MSAGPWTQQPPGRKTYGYRLLVTSPVNLVSFGALIQSAIARYERRFGPIPDAGPYVASRSEA